MPVLSPPPTSPGYSYDPRFLSYSQKISAQSAQQITTLLKELVPIESVLDVGCAQGTWLNHWQQLSIEDFLGVDGDYVIRDRLEIPDDKFVPQDVSQPFDLDRKFDLVQCLEVAEHIPAAHASTLIDNLTRHSDFIMFSAAPPGQGGEYHVNEQPYDYWRDLFQARGYSAVDGVRPSIRENSKVAVWYRHNIIIFVRTERLSELPNDLRNTVIPDGTPIPDLSPLLYKARKAIVRHIPDSIQLKLAKLVARMRG